MTVCLYDPQDGYYATRPALGPDGDFLTAPLISQTFGELIEYGKVWRLGANEATEEHSRLLGFVGDRDFAQRGPIPPPPPGRRWRT